MLACKCNLIAARSSAAWQVIYYLTLPYIYAHSHCCSLYWRRLFPTVDLHSIEETKMTNSDSLETIKRQERLEEYNSLREETLKRVELRYQIINLTLVATGALLTIGAAEKGPRSALIVYPILSLFLAAGYSYNHIMIVEMGKYIRERLEGLDEEGNEIKEDGENQRLNLGWANYLKRRHDRIRLSDFFFTFGLFLIPQAISILIYIKLMPMEDYTWGDKALLTLCALAFLSTIVVLARAIRVDPERRKKS